MSLAFSKNFLLQIDSNISLYRLKCKCIQEFFRPICLRVFEKLIWCFIFLYFSAFQKYDPGYTKYDEGIANDYFAKTPEGEVYVNAVWPGDAVFPDFGKTKVRSDPC